MKTSPNPLPVPNSPPLPFLWERLTADDFAKAVRTSGGVALLPPRIGE